MRRRSTVARYSHAGLKQGAIVVLVLDRDAHRDGLHALEARRGFKEGALLAAMQFGIAFRAIAGEIGVGGERRRAVEAARRSHVLNQTGKPRAGYIQGRTRAVGFGPVIAKTAVTVGIHIPVLFILAIAVHREGYSVAVRDGETFVNRSETQGRQSSPRQRSSNAGGSHVQAIAPAAGIFHRPAAPARAMNADRPHALHKPKVLGSTWE